MSDDTPVIQPPSSFTVDEAPPPKVLLYRADGKPIAIPRKIGFETAHPKKGGSR